MSRAVALLMIVVVLGACRQAGEIGPPAPERVTGVVVDIEAESIGDVTSFTLKDGDQTYEVFIADGVEYGFPLGHLQEHRTSGEPVAVDLAEREDDKLYALTIEDA